MKTVRQVAILDIIEKQEIETQEELASALNARGIRVTQATVSRDIKELRLLKVLTPSGKYKYATGDQADNNLTDRFIRMLAESLLSVSSANNLIVVKTLSGSANVAADASLTTAALLAALGPALKSPGEAPVLLVASPQGQSP